MGAPIHFVSISGGKDGLATALLAKERAERRGMDLRLINADLGANENPITHDYIGYLEQALGMPIQRVRADFSAEFADRYNTIEREWSQEKRRTEHTKACKARRAGLRPKDWRAACECPVRVNPAVAPELIAAAKALLTPTGEPFLDLCVLKGRFPSRTAQFCTERLKLEPMNAITHPLLEAGQCVVSWIGERAEESPKRAAKPAMQRIRWEGGGQLVLYRPCHKLTAADVFAIAKRHGVKPNPLYLMGFGRVGCTPCINCGKSELAQIDQRMPEVITRIAAWEALVAAVSRQRNATFFYSGNSGRGRGATRVVNIHQAVEWAKTSRGGRQFDLLQRLARDTADTEGAMCESAYGLCE